TQFNIAFCFDHLFVESMAKGQEKILVHRYILHSSESINTKHPEPRNRGVSDFHCCGKNSSLVIIYFNGNRKTLTETIFITGSLFKLKIQYMADITWNIFDK